MNLPKEKGVIDFAINLIDFDDEYLNAFYYAVGETLVVEDRSVANKLIGKYRMVTLSGDVFEKSGSITGGALKKNGIKFAQNQDSEIDAYKTKLKELESKHAALVAKRSSLEAKMDDIRGKYSSSSTEHSKAKLELTSLEASFLKTESDINEKLEFIKINTDTRTIEVKPKFAPTSRPQVQPVQQIQPQQQTNPITMTAFLTSPQ